MAGLDDMAGLDNMAGLDKAEDGDRPRRSASHTIGEKLDDLSVRDFEERIAILRNEIARLETARLQKRMALDEAGSIFKSGATKT